MKQSTSQEPMSDPSHSCIQESNQSNPASAGRVKFAAMLGIALSVGASGALIAQTEASAVVSAPADTESLTGDLKATTEKASDAEGFQADIVALHTVESGESLWQIAQQHRVGLHALKLANDLPPETTIRVGQVLRVPAADAATVAPEVEASGSIESFEIETRDEEVLISQSIDTAEIQEQPSIEFEISEAPSEPAPVVTAMAPRPSLESYQVRSGDTLAGIASQLGVAPEEIILVNNIVDPNMIMTGSVLRVPAAGSEPIVQGGESPSIASARVRPTSGSASDHLAYLQSTVLRTESGRMLERVRSRSTAPTTIEPQAESEPVAEQEVVDEAANNPYIEDVQDLSDVEATEVEQISIEDDRPSSSLLARSNGSEASNGLVESDLAVENSELLAAAPLSPDAYIPSQRSPESQVVSPDMPILPGADEYLPEAPNYFDGYIWPTTGTFTSGYGWRWGRMHRGIDVAGPVGTPIVAAAGGVVEVAGWNSGGYGNIVEIRHSDGSMTRYAHNSRLNVSAGQRVRQGQQIAEMGSTGYSTGPHLHFEIHVANQGAVNPMAYLPNR